MKILLLFQRNSKLNLNNIFLLKIIIKDKPKLEKWIINMHCNPCTYLSLQITILLYFIEIHAQFILNCLLQLLDSILHEQELLKLCIGPRPRRSLLILLSHTGTLSSSPTPTAPSTELILVLRTSRVLLLVLDTDDAGDGRLYLVVVWLLSGVYCHEFLLLHQVLVVWELGVPLSVSDAASIRVGCRCLSFMRPWLTQGVTTELLLFLPNCSI